MNKRPEPDGIPADVVFAKLEARLQAALDKNGLRRCERCGRGILKQDIRDVTIVRQSHSAKLPRIRGLFCDRCEGIEFDPSTDSAVRYASAVRRLVFRIRATEKWESLNPKYGSRTDGVAKSIWHAAQTAWTAYLSPVYMIAWLLTLNKNAYATKIKGEPNVIARWDAEANVWVALSDDVPGLFTEAGTLEALEKKLKALVPELMVANKLSMHRAIFRLTIASNLPHPKNDLPLYALDGG